MIQVQKLRPKGCGNQLNFTQGRTETNILLHSAPGVGEGGELGGERRGEGEGCGRQKHGRRR